MMTLVKLSSDVPLCKRLNSLMVSMGKRHWIGNLTSRIVNSLLEDFKEQKCSGVLCLIKKDIAQSKCYVSSDGKIEDTEIYRAFEKGSCN